MRGINGNKHMSYLPSEKQKENIEQVKPALRLPAGRYAQGGKTFIRNKTIVKFKNQTLLSSNKY